MEVLSLIDTRHRLEGREMLFLPDTIMDTRHRLEGRKVLGWSSLAPSRTPGTGWGGGRCCSSLAPSLTTGTGLGGGRCCSSVRPTRTLPPLRSWSTSSTPCTGGCWGWSWPCSHTDSSVLCSNQKQYHRVLHSTSLKFNQLLLIVNKYCQTWSRIYPPQLSPPASHSAPQSQP